MDGAFARSFRMLRTGPRRRVGVVGIYRDAEPIGTAVAELRASGHEVIVNLGAMGDIPDELRADTGADHLTAGKFQNLNVLVHDLPAVDWLVIIDDDIVLPRGFLDVAIEVCERLDLALAQPAQTRFSNANWIVAKRRLLSVARTTRFVEIGPVTLVRADAARLLLPFPADLRWGWGLDFRWAYLMEHAGLRMGVVDVAAVVHASRKVASTYSWDAAQEEGRAFLRGVEHLPNDVAKGRGLRTYRLLPRRTAAAPTSEREGAARSM
ncbi:hypothetical protein Microterr_01860 [Microbacterium terricola]|uniref:Glycosyltransferase n=2 Tax=Microbacterium terricola TaxID=344163 RepID=A0ABM8DVQ1_9MICO|nr:hypothetical protein Microterr_01860 [Microbacterium terricola]